MIDAALSATHLGPAPDATPELVALNSGEGDWLEIEFTRPPRDEGGVYSIRLAGRVHIFTPPGGHRTISLGGEDVVEDGEWLVEHGTTVHIRQWRRLIGRGPDDDGSQPLWRAAMDETRPPNSI